MVVDTMNNNAAIPLVCLLVSAIASLIIWSVLRVGARADAVNERYAEEMQRRAGEAEHE